MFKSPFSYGFIVEYHHKITIWWFKQTKKKKCEFWKLGAAPEPKDKWAPEDDWTLTMLTRNDSVTLGIGGSTNRLFLLSTAMEQHFE